MTVIPSHIALTVQLVDLLTKPLVKHQYNSIVTQYGVGDLFTSSPGEDRRK